MATEAQVTQVLTLGPGGQPQQPFPSPPGHSHSAGGSWGFLFLFCLGTKKIAKGAGGSSGFYLHIINASLRESMSCVGGSNAHSPIFDYRKTELG